MKKALYAVVVFVATAAAAYAAPTMSCTGSSCPAHVEPDADILSAVTISSTATLPSAVQQALAKLTADTTIYESTAGSLGVAKQNLIAAQTAVSTLSVATSAAQSTLAADNAAYSAAIADLNPGGTPVNPVTPSHTITILEVSAADDHCSACVAMRPIVAKLKTAGIPITTIADGSAGAPAVDAIPTYIIMMDGKPAGSDQKTNRWVGRTTEAQLTEWYALCKDWASKLPK